MMSDDIDMVAVEAKSHRLSALLVQTYESLEVLDRQLATLADDSRSLQSIADVFRTLHIIQGSSQHLVFGDDELIARVRLNLSALVCQMREHFVAVQPGIDTATAIVASAAGARVLLDRFVAAPAA